MIDTPRIVQTTEQWVATLPLKVPREQIREVMGPGIQEVFAAIAAQGIAPTGPWLTHHRKAPDTEFDFEICVPVASEVAPTGRVRSGRLAARKAARTVYVGPYEGLGAAWGELRAWVEAQGHARAQDLWECYAKGPESGSDAAAYRTELNQPLVG